MRLAMLQASRATPITNAFNTGVLIVSGMHVVADGRSRESNLNKHAAEIAITKARTGSLAYMLSGSTMYTTMEPCSSTRVSKIPCTTHIINAHIKTIVIGVKEPESFVNCRGVETLCAAGINVIHLRMLQEECLATNIHLLT
ncbi:cytidine deaminase-like protein [Coemansia spiralis]|nr:cytidine deaminase-like protein [Coemansia spiralis]